MDFSPAFPSTGARFTAELEATAPDFQLSPLLHRPIPGADSVLRGAALSGSKGRSFDDLVEFFGDFVKVQFAEHCKGDSD